MRRRAAITVHRPRQEVERLWQTSELRPSYIERKSGAVTFAEAPGDRGTEIHVELGGEAGGGPIPETVQKLAGAMPLAKVRDELRRFKQQVETGQITRSEGSPEGERAERKLKQRPAQPLDDSELQKAGLR